MSSPTSLQASPTNQDPINLQYAEIGDRRLAGDLGVERLPAVQARARGVAILRPARKSPSGTYDPRSKVRPRNGVAISGRVVPCPARIDRPGASMLHWEERGP